MFVLIWNDLGGWEVGWEDTLYTCIQEFVVQLLLPGKLKSPNKNWHGWVNVDIFLWRFWQIYATPVSANLAFQANQSVYIVLQQQQHQHKIITFEISDIFLE